MTPIISSLNSLKKCNNTQFSNSVSKLETSLLRTLDELAPIKYKYITQRLNCKWLNSELSSSKRKLRLYENYWRKSKSLNNYNIFIKQRSLYRTLLKKPTKSYYNNLLK